MGAWIELEEADRVRWIDAFTQLALSLDPVGEAAVKRAVKNTMAWFQAGQPTSQGYDILGMAVYTIVSLHITQNRPLALPTPVLAVYVEGGPDLELPLLECERCGYLLPRCFVVCPLCGGATAHGAFAARRARVAGLC